MRPSRLRRTASPVHMPRPRSASRRRPATNPIATAKPASGDHHGRPSGPTSVNEVSTASTASIAMIGTSAAISAGIRGTSSRPERFSTAMRAPAPTCALTRLPRLPRPPARNSRRREIVPPAARTHTCHASQRVSSATTCSAVTSSSTQTDASRSAWAKSSRCPASATASTAATPSAPTAVAAVLPRSLWDMPDSSPRARKEQAAKLNPRSVQATRFACRGEYDQGVVRSPNAPPTGVDAPASDVGFSPGSRAGAT